MADGASGKLYTQTELDAAVLAANLYLAENLHEAFTSDDVAEAVELLKLKEHERPEGYVSWNGTPHVRIPEPLVSRLRNAQTADEVRALCVLLLTERAEAEHQREEQVRSDAYEMNGAGAVTP
jgi:L-lysine 2,3-aminomutase